MGTLNFRNSKSRMLVSALFYLSIVGAGHSFEFDDRILADMGLENIDLSAFEGGNEGFTGERRADILVNGISILQREVIYIYQQNSVDELCFTPQFIKKLPFKNEIKTRLSEDVIHSTDAGECLGIMNLDENVQLHFDENNETVHITVPHLFLDRIDRDWIAPEDRDSGVSGVFLDYSILGTYNKNKGRSSDTTVRSYGTIGANIKDIRFRINYQYNSDNKQQDKLEFVQKYAFMDIGSLNAKLYAGELFSRSNVFDSVRFKGVSLFTDADMMPSYLRGYAPEVTGVANTDSIVTLKQYGVILRTVQVPAGAFAISDLPSYISGTIDVEIEESNGSTRTYQVDIAHVPFLTRKGALRYSLNAGELNPYQSSIERGKVQDKFFSGDASYGLSNIISLYGGTQFTTNGDYIAVNAGIGASLGIIGAVSFDITQSKNTADPSKDMKGHSLRFNYAKRFTSNTNLNLVGYRFSSRNYTSIHNYLDMKTHQNRFTALEKNRITLSLSQSIPEISSSVSASMTKGTYWNQRSISNYSLSFNKQVNKGLLEGASLQITAARNTDIRGIKDNQIGMFITIPLNQERNSRLQYNARYQDASEYLTQEVTYFDKIYDGNMTAGVFSSGKRDFSGSSEFGVTGSFDKDLYFGRVSTSGNYTSDRKYFSAGFDGSITVTKTGVATHKRVYEDASRLIVDAGAPGVQVGFSNDDRSNFFGMAGISNVPNYYNMTYKIDIDNLPDNVSIEDNVIEVALTDGAIGYRALDAVTGEKAIITIMLPNGSHPPFGATVYRENGADTEVGIVSENGLTYLTGLNNKSEYSIKWGRDQSCNLKITTPHLSEFETVICYTE